MSTHPYASSSQGVRSKFSQNKRLVENWNRPAPRGSFPLLRSTVEESTDHTRIINSDPKPPVEAASNPNTRSTTSSTNHQHLSGITQDNSASTYPTILEPVTVKRVEPVSSKLDGLLDAGLVHFSLKMQLQNSALVDQIHIFNTLFFRKLSIGGHWGCKRYDYKAVKKWTSKSDIFSKRFIIVPIEERSCWYLAIICFPGHILKVHRPQLPAQSASHSANVAAEKTRIVILDPYQCLRPRTVETLRQYLQDEARERHNEVVNTSDTELVGDQHLITPMKMRRDFYLIYILHYVKMFFANPLDIMALRPDAKQKRKEQGNRYDELWGVDQVVDRGISFPKKLRDLSAEWSAFNSSRPEGAAPTIGALQ